MASPENEKPPRTPSMIQHFITGGLSSMFAEFVTIPVDVTKVRLQLQGELQGHSTTGPKYRGMIHGAYVISKEEGVKGLYKGLTPALLRQAVYASLRVGLYGHVKAFFKGDSQEKELPFWKKVVAGATCGALGACIANPTDLVKVRMQAEARLPPGQHRRYKNTLDAFKQIYQKEGLTGLWKGVGPATQRAAIVNGVELATYDHLKYLIISSKLTSDGAPAHFLSSFATGFFSTLFSNPVDVLKTRMMSQPSGPDGKGLKYSSTIDCLVKTVRSEGLFALYKGFIPNYMRLGPWCVVMFMSFEQFNYVYEYLSDV